MYVARAVKFAVRGKPILSGIDLRLTAGKIVAAVGPNGAGKSTLLKIIAGERKPTGGEILLDERPLREWPARALARRRAVLPQSVEVVFPFVASEVAGLGLPADLSRRHADAVVHRALAAVDLDDFADRVYGTLSGGEKQRVQFARVLAQVWCGGNGGYLLLDEPTANLDLAHQLLMLRIAREHAAAGGGVFMVLHDLNLAVMVADEIVALKDGCKIAAGAPEAVMTADLVAALYGVRVQMRAVPDGPFLLPQTARPPV